MNPPWPRIRALNYGTIGRTIHAVARYAGSEVVEELWFEGPKNWRTERDGVPVMIESATDEYRRSPDGMVHTSRTDGVLRMTAVAGAYSKTLFTSHHYWPIPGGFDHSSLGDPEGITEAYVYERRGRAGRFRRHRPPPGPVVHHRRGRPASSSPGNPATTAWSCCRTHWTTTSIPRSSPGTATPSSMRRRWRTSRPSTKRRSV